LLGNKFKIGANEELTHFLLLKITRNVEDELVFLSQSHHYIEDVQKRFLPGNHLNVSTPSDLAFKDLAQRKENKEKSSGPYPQLIGSLLWLAQCTQPDISFFVNLLSQFLRNPSNIHWHAAVRVLRYVISTKELKLRLGGKIFIAGYSDLDWAEDRKDCC
jgi:hypothetical protein